MKTLAIDIGDDEWKAAERRAAQQSASLPELVRDFLRDLAREENGAQAQARRDLLALSEQSQAVVGAINWQRAELHER